MSVCQSEALSKVWPLDCWTQSARGYKEVTIRRKTELHKIQRREKEATTPKDNLHLSQEKAEILSYMLPTEEVASEVPPEVKNVKKQEAWSSSQSENHEKNQETHISSKPRLLQPNLEQNG